MVTGLGSEHATLACLVLSMLQNYEITVTDTPTLQNPQEQPDMWALAARALTLAQLGVGLRLRLCACERLGALQADPWVCCWPWFRWSEVVQVVHHGVLSSLGFGLTLACLHTPLNVVSVCGGGSVICWLCWWLALCLCHGTRARMLAMDWGMDCCMSALDFVGALLCTDAN